MSEYFIKKKTPASNWHVIHKGLSLEEAKDIIVGIAELYDKDDQKWGESSISDEGETLHAYDYGDLHEFRVFCADE